VYKLCKPEIYRLNEFSATWTLRSFKYSFVMLQSDLKCDTFVCTCMYEGEWRSSTREGINFKLKELW